MAPQQEAVGVQQQKGGREKGLCHVTVDNGERGRNNYPTTRPPKKIMKYVDSDLPTEHHVGYGIKKQGCARGGEGLAMVPGGWKHAFEA